MFYMVFFIFYLIFLYDVGRSGTTAPGPWNDTTRFFFFQEIQNLHPNLSWWIRFRNIIPASSMVPGRLDLAQA